MQNFKLNDLPLGEQAKRQIVKYIDAMDLEHSNKLPREEELAKIINVSRVTIRKALNDLASEGLVFRQHGRGTFVNVDSLSIKVKFNPVMEFTKMIEESGYRPSVKLLSIQEVPEKNDIANMLQLSDQATLIRVEKLFMANDLVCAFCVDYIDIDLIGGREKLKAFSRYDKSVYKYLYEHSNQQVEWDKIEIDTLLGRDIQNFATHVDLDHYGLKPYLRLKGLNFNNDNKPLLYTEEYIDTGIIKFSMIRQHVNAF